MSKQSTLVSRFLCVSAALALLACGSDDRVTSPTAAGQPATAKAMYTLVDLGGPGGASMAAAINPAGMIAGQNQGPPSFQSHAALWVNGVPNDLGTLGGPSSQGNALNTLGQVVGVSALGPARGDTPFSGRTG